MVAWAVAGRKYWWRLSLYETEDGAVKHPNHPFRRIEFQVSPQWENRPDRNVIDAKLAKVGYSISRKLDRRAKLKEHGGEWDWRGGASSYVQQPGQEKLGRVGDMERPFVRGPGPMDRVTTKAGVRVIDWPNGRRESQTPNPPWSDKAIAKNWEAMVKEVGAKWMPLDYTPKPGYLDHPYQELGEGHYGVVFRTHTPGVVMKITSDDSEARFIVAALSLGELPEGIVRYFDIMRLPGTHRRRPLYAIWREEATRTGDLLTARDRERADKWVQGKRTTEAQYLGRAEKEFQKHLIVWQEAAGRIRDWCKRKGREQFRHNVQYAQKLDHYEDAVDFVNRWHRGADMLGHLKGIHRLSTLLDACRISAELMEHSYGSDAVGGTFGFYLEHGIVLADVHYGNIGQVVREDHEITVITDPGHAVFLDGKFDDLFRRADLDAPGSKTPNPETKATKRRKSAFHRLMRI